MAIDTWTIRETNALVRSFPILENLGLIESDDIAKGRALLARRDQIISESKGARPDHEHDAAINRLVAGESSVRDEALLIANESAAEHLSDAAADRIKRQVHAIMSKRADEVGGAFNDVIAEAVEQAQRGFAALNGIIDAAQAIDAGLADAWQATVNAKRVVAQVHKDADTLRDAYLLWSPRQADRSHWAVRYRRQPNDHHDWTRWMPYVAASANEFEDAAIRHAIAGGGWAGDDE